MLDIDQIYKISDVLTKEERDLLDKFDVQHRWEMANSSYFTAKSFWKKNFWSDSIKCHEVEQLFRNKIQNMLSVQLETVEAYMNGQAHGQCGSLHSDEKPSYDKNSDYITLVYYVNKEWSPEMGGYTTILDKMENIHIVYPKPNSGVVFNSRLPHVGLEPTCHCTTQRVSYAHKFKVLR